MSDYRFSRIGEIYTANTYGEPLTPHLVSTSISQPSGAEISSMEKLPHIETIRAYLGCASIHGLVGTKILAPADYEHTHRLNYWYHYCRTEGNYAPPSDDAILQSSAEQLAQGKSPQFPEVDTRSVHKAFDKHFGWGSETHWKSLTHEQQEEWRNTHSWEQIYNSYGDPAFIDRFSSMIRDASGNTRNPVRLTAAEVIRLRNKIRGTAVYLNIEGAPRPTIMAVTPWGATIVNQIV